MTNVTQLLSAVQQGNEHAANQLLLVVYQELRELAAQKLALEKPGQTLDATGLLGQPWPFLRRGRHGHASHPRGPCPRPPRGKTGR
jgi:hypothetical protein